MKDRISRLSPGAEGGNVGLQDLKFSYKIRDFSFSLTFPFGDRELRIEDGK